jgi:hypothetical protein
VAMAAMAIIMSATRRPTNLFSLTNEVFTSLTTFRPLLRHYGPVKSVGSNIYGLCLTSKATIIIIINTQC